MKKRKKRFIVSVFDFGAKGDGLADDSPAFRAAKRSKAHVIKVPRGTYYVSGEDDVVDNRFITVARKGKRS